MPRRVEVVLPSSRSEELLAALGKLEGVLALRRLRDASLRPAGDLVSAEVTSAALPQLMRMLDERKIGGSAETLVVTSQPTSLLVTPREAVSRDRSEATWEEMDAILARESNMTINGVWLMASAGAIAAAGVTSSALYLVVAAMLIAPGFEPLVRISLGAVTRSAGWWSGVVDTLKGYVALVAGALTATLLMGALGLTPSRAAHLPGAILPSWTSLSTSGVLVAIVAGSAGAVLIDAARSVLTAGVMVALALIPSAALVGFGVATGDGDLALRGGLRWASEAALVTMSAALVFWWKRRRVHRRRSTD